MVQYGSYHNQYNQQLKTSQIEHRMNNIMARQKLNNESMTMRWPADMLRLVRQLAGKENRSINAQFVTLVQESLARRGVASNPAGTSPAGVATDTTV